MKKILINSYSWQTRVAIIRNNSLENIYFRTEPTESLERSYFKGTISKILPGIQTAFVAIGQAKAGFLHISEIDRAHALKRMGEQLEDLEDIETLDEGETPAKAPYVPFDISKILKEKEPILVQVSKEPVYEKGAKLTTCFTLPGRFVVLMPNIPRIGISKKIENKEERQRLKELVKKRLPDDMGAIIRTSCEKKSEDEIGQDLTYLIDTWTLISKRYKEAQPQEKLYEDIDLVLQIIRDHLDDDVEYIICDTQDMHDRVHKFVKHIAPEFTAKVRLYTGQPNIFEKYGLEKQINQALEKKVFLKSGGSLIIETTEAMTVIDVNTGRYTGQSNLEDTLLKTNLDAADEIVRQLRLRNIGGLIVIDFIDMASAGNRQKLYRFLEKTLKEHDKFQSVVLKVSEFGLVQMTRKRSGKTLIQNLTETCSTCKGMGCIKSTRTEAFTLLRKVSDLLNAKKERKTPVLTVNLAVHPAIFTYITEVEYNAVLLLEKTHKCRIILTTHERPEYGMYNISVS